MVRGEKIWKKWEDGQMIEREVKGWLDDREMDRWTLKEKADLL